MSRLKDYFQKIDKRKAKNEALKSRIALLVIIVFIGSAYYYGQIFKDDIIEHRQYVLGTIYETSRGYRGGVEFSYSFVFEDSTYYGAGYLGISSNYVPFFLNKKFPVIYSEKTMRNEMLILPRDFKRFELEFPDSLRWVLDSLK